ncbi:hypothetical protein [Amycolatopsis azurea]|uniref:hypothetical protein n=1 Tax=Amycolatopsis azurea TaxID=36819 RepID=UPI001FD82DBF|nr:hypothetical protein [Amycolatopsis azurea]
MIRKVSCVRERCLSILDKRSRIASMSFSDSSASALSARRFRPAAAGVRVGDGGGVDDLDRLDLDHPGFQAHDVAGVDVLVRPAPEGQVDRPGRESFEDRHGEDHRRYPISGTPERQRLVR